MSAKAIHHKVCVVGAGPCGLTTIESLVRNGISDVVCHEAQDSIGGLWAFSKDTKRPSVYDSAHIISSRRMSAFRDFPMPKDYPDFPSHKQILAYFESYANLHKLRSYIRFKSSVQSAERMADGGWSLIIEDADGTHEETAEFLVVATGHHRKPFTPRIASDFDGEQMHSSEYRSTKGFEGKRVLVVGAGNSACDIAASLARVSDHVSLSMRSPQYIVPKTIYGRPVDVQFGKIQGLPHFARRLILRLGLRIFMGRYGSYGLPQPDTDVLSSHPTLNTDILEMLTHGKVTICSETQEASGNSIKFSNGDSASFDTIIWATGYRTQFPFLKDARFDWSESLRLPLYLKMMPIDIDDLYFVGLIQPLGCIWALADYQSELVAQIINKTWQRPLDIEKRLVKEHAQDSEQYSNTTRHAVEVDFHDYKKTLLRELNA